MLSRDGDRGLRLRVRVTPKAARDRIQGVAVDAAGLPHLKIQVSAPAEGGKANVAALKLLAKAFKCPKTSLSIVSGATDRSKVVAISGDPVELEPRMKNIIEGDGS